VLRVFGARRPNHLVHAQPSASAFIALTPVLTSNLLNSVSHFIKDLINSAVGLNWVSHMGSNVGAMFLGHVMVEVRSRSPRLWGWNVRLDGSDTIVERSDAYSTTRRTPGRKASVCLPASRASRPCGKLGCLEAYSAATFRGGAHGVAGIEISKQVWLLGVLSLCGVAIDSELQHAASHALGAVRQRVWVCPVVSGWRA
jgi:hypothetical protein